METEFKPIPVATAERVAAEHGCRQVILMAWDGKATHVVTWGFSREDAQQAADGGNRFKMAMNWPEELCRSVPELAKKHSMTVLNTALCIADESARSDIECNAKWIPHPDGDVVYDLRFPMITGATDAAQNAHAVSTATRAAKYIEQRGDVFPWRMVHVDGAPHLVRFVDKET
ncbi:MAG: hypothetical protein LCH57_09845 [Proteobacteria bacterium]|nr:hypothetical protein [Pseudomonadota bacterium]